ncbi:MAG: aldo/keto reductase [Deltaproteobacteria bacterium]|jgi:voltage-dependent potassium channel beta subunit|nr:aldo/keto reductase [Deltaproteobacteria bacterium]
MQHNRLGKAGLKISELSFGSWVTFHNQLSIKEVMDTMSIAYDHGVNFFDNAEVYAHGKSEEIMGEALKKLAWPRMKYMVSTKFFWGISDGPNEKNTLNRKYLLHAMECSLKRFSLEYVDIVYCHRPDPHTPLEETVWAMHDIISKGQALYWGTSEWSADEIRAAYLIAEKHHLHKPIVEQPQYNLFHRAKVEHEFSRLYEDFGVGLTTWSPLSSGLLSGKYLDKIPNNSRAQMKSMSWLREEIDNEKKKNQIKQFCILASDLSMKPSQLAISWCLTNPHVSSVILGASSNDQLIENLKSTEYKKLLTPEIVLKLNTIFC